MRNWYRIGYARLSWTLFETIQRANSGASTTVVLFESPLQTRNSVKFAGSLIGQPQNALQFTSTESVSDRFKAKRSTQNAQPAECNRPHTMLSEWKQCFPNTKSWMNIHFKRIAIMNAVKYSAVEIMQWNNRKWKIDGIENGIVRSIWSDRANDRCVVCDMRNASPTNG